MPSNDDINLSSVNWEHGMLLTPDHFVRQERYFDSALLWALRYCTAAFGLVGGGARLPEAERGAVRHDPVVTLEEDDQAVSVAVTQCRGLTPAGCIIDIDPEHPVRRSFPKAEMEGVAESPIYIITDPAEKEVIDGRLDEFNPQMKTERRPAYRISLRVHADSAPYAISVARLRRASYGAGYEKDAQYIPPCTSLVSHSELAAGWRRILDEGTALCERYTALYRAMREYLALFTERGIETDLDRDNLDFVGRMVVALQNALYESLDPVQTPERFFSRLRQFFHSSAVYLDLSPPVRQYFEQMIETGETEFITLLEQQKQILGSRRRWEVQEDLAIEIRSALSSLAALGRLERALEGKYIDFRISPSLEAMNFVFDRGGKVLYKLAAKPARVQGYADELTLFFANLRLEGREKYRLILVGEQNAVFEKGAKISVEIKINEGAGFRRQPAIVSCEARSVEQRNFEFDFDAPDVPTITDLRIGLPAHHPIRTALLFVRHRFYAAAPSAPPQPAAAPPTPVQPAAQPVQRLRVPAEDLLDRPRSQEPPPARSSAPWDRPQQRSDEPPPPPTRRRRLE
jgi:hypothetical protein